MDIGEMLLKTGWVRSKSEGRRAVKQGAIKINNIVINDPFADVKIKNNICVVTEKGSLNLITPLPPIHGLPEMEID